MLVKIGNGAIETRDGSVYKGVGFIHLTGKINYINVVNEWNKMHPDDQLTLNQELIEKAKTDVDLAMKLAMVYWKINKLNELIKFSEYNDLECAKISKRINGGDNGAIQRKTNTKNAFNYLTNKKNN